MVKRGLAILLATFLVVTGCDFRSPIQRVRDSLVRITGIKIHMTHMGPFPGEYFCTGFVIAEPDIVLTANHCLGTDMLGDGLPVKTIRGDQYYDLALIKVEGLQRPQINIRATLPTEGEHLTAIGYGEGFTVPIPVPEVVLIPNQRLEGQVAAPGIIVLGGYVGGMSGGPLVDNKGTVVGIVQQAVDYFVGYGVDATFILSFIHDVQASN